MHLFKDKDNKNVLLLHIPKCAGTSCGHLLQQATKQHRWYNLHDNYYNDHMPLQVAKYIVEYDYSICFVRNPYHRFASKYCYLTKFSYHHGYADYTIDEFLDKKINLQDSGCWTPEGWRLQVEYIQGVNRVYKIEEHNPIDVINNLLGTNLKQDKVNTSNNNIVFNDDQKEKIYSIYKNDFEQLGYSK